MIWYNRCCILMIHKIISAKQVLFMNKCSLKHGSFLLSFVTPAYIEFKNSKIRVVFFFEIWIFQFRWYHKVCHTVNVKKNFNIKIEDLLGKHFYAPSKKKTQSKKGNNNCWFIQKNLRGDDLVIVCSRGWWWGEPKRAGDACKQ